MKRNSLSFYEGNPQKRSFSLLDFSCFLKGFFADPAEV
ncbi:hypothetical protein LEP1GSC171_1752 [Leptospira santarosai str. HAI1380]|uniref:Uncharacterized protein n=1 Tax=Leptospira santarosai str. ZUN179 TaxID=1049985 RepID=M6UL96_9LEPT|nr:hypothetical protein LEP1GSC068_2682 [Leptospira sp. Fiocruz LV3954]EMF91905.1 hypothetical protein LEP1GSC005_3762 [Leptospira santarosai str. ST188]EMI68597.1 hypothetical protein LEP1GSC076_0499 [Leptospira sp. Fiocruz LV4135]EMO34498.1 hypothetical protein LEP1GSC175_3228 [Leptospira santarosai str. HAI821]EMO43561.1 hypothetical protein LEP1GSC187_2977 [Leptospira santarosai str. ZUN179]EMP04198.1 hypothetical protein LEP1GSC171_1752 [Leptospira santarosai str. HAI1380]